MSDRTKDLDVDASKAMEDARCQPTLTECPHCHNDLSKCVGLFKRPAEETTGRCPVAGCTNTDPQHIKHFTENGKG